MEETEFGFFTGQNRFVRILHYGSKGGIGKAKSPFPPSVKGMGQETECVGIPVKAGKIALLLLRQLIQIAFAPSLPEEIGDGLLPGMTERGITHVMSKAGGRDNGPYLCKQGRIRWIGSVNQPKCHHISQRPANTSHFKRVGEPVVHKDASRQWKYLRLILQPSEWGGEDDAVIIALKSGSDLFRLVVGPGFKA